jgi:hypothetical protein
MIKQKGKEWLRRYLPAEIVGTISALISANIAHAFYDNLIVVAYIATICEAIGYYSTVVVLSILLENKKQKNQGKTLSFRGLFKISLGMILEFGPAGLLDEFVLRPFFMYLFPVLLQNFTLGIFFGKITADIVFYFLVIMSYEINKRARTPK